MTEMKMVRLSDENVELLKKYGKTPNQAVSDLLLFVPELKGDTIIGPGVVPQTVTGLSPEMKSAIEDAIEKKIKPIMEKYEAGHKTLYGEILSRLSSLGGHSAPQEGDHGFRRATMSLREEK
jgi:hypothetical protein